MRRAIIVLLTALVGLASVTGIGSADVPVGLARYVACPGVTGEPQRYRGVERAPFRCHSAVRDPIGNVVIIRQGRSNASRSAFGWLHASFDHNVDDHVMERILSSSYPRTAPAGRTRYSAELRAEGHGIMVVLIEVDRRPSHQAPDDEPFGVVTAYCKLPRNAHPENKCPEWVNDSLLP
jgi:hypothetical protein